MPTLFLVFWGISILFFYSGEPIPHNYYFIQYIKLHVYIHNLLHPSASLENPDEYSRQTVTYINTVLTQGLDPAITVLKIHSMDWLPGGRTDLCTVIHCYSIIQQRQEIPKCHRAQIYCGKINLMIEHCVPWNHTQIKREALSCEDRKIAPRGL